jgi:hypothetical protein
LFASSEKNETWKRSKLLMVVVAFDTYFWSGCTNTKALTGIFLQAEVVEKGQDSPDS